MNTGETTSTTASFFDRMRGYLRIKNPLLRKTVGTVLVLVGLLALVTPLTPGAWLGLIGLEMLGVHLTLGQSVKLWLKKRGWWSDVKSEE